MIALDLKDACASKNKADFVNGSLDEPLRYSPPVTIPSKTLQTTWSNIKLSVFRPALEWRKILLDRSDENQR
jgi:hypothetical protein